MSLYYCGNGHQLDYPNQMCNICLATMVAGGEFNMIRGLTFEQLRYANVQRNKEWDPEGKISALFRSTEFAGEAGEICNVVKKIERERMGLKGSRSSLLDLAAELADTQITLDLLAMHYSIDIGAATILAFNKKSSEHGFITVL